MGISTKRAKRVVQEQVMSWSGGGDNDALVIVSNDPDIAVVWKERINTILTVLPRTDKDYIRTPDGYEVIE